jgi:hypothetical protein
LPSASSSTDVDTCYRSLGVVHNLYKPVPGRFKDYIAIPKSNGYQSLHTILFGPQAIPIEIQIRSTEMDRVAESGIAAHWQYKAGGESARTAQSRAREWLKDVLEIQNSVGNSIEFLENVKVDLFPDEVYTFTPEGDILVLPRDATPIDFAYAVHSDVGNRCVAAKIDRQLAPLSVRLQSGQTVEIVTAPGARPNPAWLSFVVTGKARSGIRHCLKSMQSDEARCPRRAPAGEGPERAGCQAEAHLPGPPGSTARRDAAAGPGQPAGGYRSGQPHGYAGRPPDGRARRVRTPTTRPRHPGGQGHRGAGAELRPLLPPDPG